MRVEALDHRRLERLAVEPHVELAGVALDHVDAGQRPRVVELDAGRPVDVQRPPRGVAERVVGEQLGLDHQAVERAVQRALPRSAGGTFDLVQSHSSTLAMRSPGGRYGHRMRRALIALSILAVAAVVAAPAASAKVRQGPKGAAFYEPPGNAHGKHGTLIWARRQTGPDAIAGRRSRLLLYRSTGPDGKANAVSGSLALPKGKAPKGGWPVITLRARHHRLGRHLRADPRLRRGHARQLRLPAAASAG